MKEQIIKRAIQFIALYGAQDFTARKLAKFVGISTRPFYYYFKDIADLKKALIVEVLEKLKETMSIKYTDNLYLNIGIGYVVFAKKYPEYYYVMNLRNFFDKFDEKAGGLEIDQFVLDNSHPDLKDIYEHIKTYTIGLALLVSESPDDYSIERVSDLLMEAYKKLQK